MCGIILYINTSGDDYPKTLQKGLFALKHRGPDSEGSYQDNGLFLGHRRLKIIDLSDNANQPMSCDNERYWIVFNGEIYNFLDLRHLLETKGYRFITKSDTEVLLKLYQEFGERCLEYINGMFAFIVYDSHKNSLFAARDRFGIKPLYYYWNNKILAIASEIKAFLASDIVDHTINASALAQYLTYGSVQCPLTIFKSIKSLMPGNYLSFKNNTLCINEYWRIPSIPEKEKPNESFENAVQRVRDLLEDSIRLRMISDVPLGAFLSGGIDSSIIVALMSQISTKQVKTFSIGFNVGGDSYNETKYAQRIAKKYNTEHHEINITGNDIVNEYPNFIKYLDQPSIDGFNSYLISKFASKHVTVCLSGLGGDEIFAGYTKTKFYHYLATYRNRFLRLPKTMDKLIQSMHKHFPEQVKRNRFVRGSLAICGVWRNPLDYFTHFKTYHDQHELGKLLINSENAIQSKSEISDEYITQLSPLDAATFYDITVYMRNTLLRDVDAVSMAHSLEVRVPFLDHRLAEYVMLLPISLRMKRGEPKYLLTSALSDILPGEIIYRKKMGFSFPFGIWLLNSPLRDVMLDCFSMNGLKKRGIFHTKELDKLLNIGMKKDSTKRPSFIHYKLWMLMILELWLRETNAQID